MRGLKESEHTDYSDKSIMDEFSSCQMFSISYADEDDDDEIWEDDEIAARRDEFTVESFVDQGESPLILTRQEVLQFIRELTEWVNSCQPKGD